MPDDPRTTISPLELQLAHCVELITVLREAVEHYADPKHWRLGYTYTGDGSIAQHYGYTVAQAALARYQAVLDAHMAQAGEGEGEAHGH